MKKVILILSFVLAGRNLYPQSLAEYIDSLMVKVPQGIKWTGFCETEGKGIYKTHTTGVRSTIIPEFYIHKYEVTNELYDKFRLSVKKSQFKLFEFILPDSTLFDKDEVWIYQLPGEYYFTNVYFASYPVVGVSHYQCEFFCRWLTDEYNADPKRKFKKVKIKLPSNIQWEHASSVSCEKIGDSLVKRDFSNDFSTENGKLMGYDNQFQCNYRSIDEERVFVLNGNSNDEAITLLEEYPTYYQISDSSILISPVSYFKPNCLGIFNMTGNIEEFLDEYGITKGGSCITTSEYLRNQNKIRFDMSSEVKWSRGFRFVMEIIEE